jgi:hypothetical protein
MTAQTTPTPDHIDDDQATSDNAIDPAVGGNDGGRRALLRKVAIGGAGAAVAAMAFDRTALAGDQAGTAIGGNAVELGLDTNTAVDPTVIEVTPAAPLIEGPSAFSSGGYVPAANFPFPAGVGGYGDDTIPNGVHGSTTEATGYGVVAANLAPAAADDTEVPPAALALASANGPHIKFVGLPDSVAGPTPGLHEAGELYVDADGTLWFTVPVPPQAPVTTPGVRFVKLAGADTAGSFHALPVAKRCFDSRQGTAPAKIAESGTVDIDLTKDTAGAASGFPAGARLALVNLTVTQTEGPGFAQLYAKGTPVAQVQTSNINWFQDETTIANSTGVPVDATGSITARVGSSTTDTTTARTHIIVDLVGYYR